MSLVLALALGCSGDPPAPAPPPPRKPDVLLVVMDTVRADALSAHGSARPTSPRFDAITEHGVRFTQATAPGSWTWPSHGSLFTGTWPWEHGAHFAPAEGEGGVKAGTFLELHAFSTELPTLAERFASAGYQTVSISGNRLIDHNTGMARGFAIAEYAETDQAVVERATAALQAADDRPMLMFLNLYSAHAPYAAAPVPWVEVHKDALSPKTAPDWLRPLLVPGPAVRPFHPLVEGGPPAALSILRGEHPVPPEGWAMLRDLYDGEVARVDHHLGQALGAWAAAGRTGIVAITSDHGEYFGEHGQLDHGRTLFPEVTHVPLALVAPGQLPAGRTIDTPVPMHALHDTLLDLADLGPAPDSLLPVIEGGPSPWPVLAGAYVDPYFAREVGGDFTLPWRLLREGDQALLVGGEGEGRQFDLARDPSMNAPLPAVDPAMRARLDQRVPVLVSDGGPRVAVDDETARALHELGYVDREPATRDE